MPPSLILAEPRSARFLNEKPSFTFKATWHGQVRASLRGFLSELDKTGDLRHVRREVSARYEIAAVAHKLDAKPLLFEDVKESEGLQGRDRRLR